MTSLSDRPADSDVRTPQQVVEDFFGALGSGDTTGAIAALSEDVTWFVPGDRAVVPWTGEWHGREEMRQFFSIVGEVAEPRAFELHKTLADGDDVVVLGRFAYYYPGSGQVFDDEFAMHFRVRDGQIASYRIHEDSRALERAFTGA
jgi:ketosteroid isomerase-like protein